MLLQIPTDENEQVSVTMDTKRPPVRHLVVMATILAIVIFAYVYVSNSGTPTRITQTRPSAVVSRDYQTKNVVKTNTVDGKFGEIFLDNDDDKVVKNSDENVRRADHDDEQEEPILNGFRTTLDVPDNPRTTLTKPTDHGAVFRDSMRPRPHRCSKCFQPRLVPTIPSRYICRPTEIAGTVDIITLIFSHVSHRPRRDAIRQTWARPTKQNTAILRHIFVLGLSQDPEVNRAVHFENKENFDILQFDFLDTYNNLTIKTIGALKWAMQRCPMAKHVVKTDDDMWLNLQRLLWVLPRYDLMKAVGGYCIKDGTPVRDSKSKWYIPYQTYPGKTYPPFCSGTGYVLQMQTVKDILRVSPNVPYFPLEDVYIGLCLGQLGYRVQSLPGFHNTFVHFDPCTYRKTVVTSHNVDDDLLHWAWNSDCIVHPYIIENT